jgi:hypothetical protein
MVERPRKGDGDGLVRWRRRPAPGGGALTTTVMLPFSFTLYGHWVRRACAFFSAWAS